ncbi:MAG: nucleotidyltransferase family protein [Actinobacteria bacterium]|nr:nucleotidyltransferase family protein [Actinomycetota bacterium]
MTTSLDAAMRRLTDAAIRDRTDRVESRIGSIVELLEAASIPAIVLKGPATRLRLYATDEPRPTADIDLLVEARNFRRATRILHGARGYRRVDRHGHSDALRARDEPDVDLHLTLPYATVPPSQVFAVLAAHRVPLAIGDGPTVPVLDLPAHAVHLAIHAAVNRFEHDDRTFEEWRRAFEALGDDLDVAGRVATAIGADVVWDAARRALDPAVEPATIAASLPPWEIVPRVRSLRGAAASGIPARVRWRDAQRLVALQLSDDTLNKWRADQGLTPAVPGTVTTRLSKLHRLIVVGGRGARRIVTRSAP